MAKRLDPRAGLCILIALCVLLGAGCLYLWTGQRGVEGKLSDALSDSFVCVDTTFERICGEQEPSVWDMQELKTAVDQLCGQLQLLYHAEAVEDHLDMAYAYNMFMRLSAYLQEAIEASVQAGSPPPALHEELDSIYDLMQSTGNVMNAAKALEESPLLGPDYF